MLFYLYFTGMFCSQLPETCSSAGLIAFTFDDGPIDYTNEILDIAKENDIPLTFNFTVHQKNRGKIADIYKRAVEEGHTVGLRVNPTRDYDNMSYDDVEDDILRQIESINETTGTKIKYARAPVENGEVNEDVYAVLSKNDIVQTSYTFRPYEHDDPVKEFEDTLKGSNPNFDSFIVALHDSQEQNNQYLEEFVEIARKYGYTVVNMDSCLGDYKPEESVKTKKSSLSEGGVENIFILPLLTLMFYVL